VFYYCDYCMQETDDNEPPLEDTADPVQAVTPSSDPLPTERDVPVNMYSHSFIKGKGKCSPVLDTSMATRADPAVMTLDINQAIGWRYYPLGSWLLTDHHCSLVPDNNRSQWLCDYGDCQLRWPRLFCPWPLSVEQSAERLAVNGHVDRDI